MRKILFLLSAAILLSAQILSAQGLRVVYEEILSPARSGINDSISIENPEIRAIIEKQRQSLILKKQTELVINKGASLHSILQKNGVQDAAEEKISVDNTILNVQRDIQTPTGDLLIYKNIITNETVIQEEFDGKTYLTEDSLVKINWKTGKEKKNIAGYECIRATAETGKQEVVAWYCPDIPVSDGPRIYWGLPGLILEVEAQKGVLVYTCTSIKTLENAPEIEKPDKGEKIDKRDLNKIKEENRAKRIEDLRNRRREIPEKEGSRRIERKIIIR